MVVEIGRDELLRLVISLEKFGKENIHPSYQDKLEKRPFINGDHWRFKSEFIYTATNEQLIEIYDHYSPTFKLIKAQNDSHN